MKIREAIVAVVKGYKKMEGASSDLKEFIDMEACDKSLLDQLFAIREDGCRLAIVKEKGELPFPMCTIRMNDPRYQDGVMIHTQKLMLEAHYVQEVVDE